MARFFLFLLGTSSLATLLILYLGHNEAAQTLSPQGCRMSRMSPSYIQQARFDAHWTQLGNRYSLWLYREVGWEPNEIGGSAPVLFIPGNAGSSRQVRSIASSAARQYYTSPYNANTELTSKGVKHLDFFAVEFNEDLSAFHGSTLESQIIYTSDAVRYILSLYPQGTKITIMGHSMGGIVATSLLPSDDIAAIITMSTPHTLPPVRFDSRIDGLYDHNHQTLQRAQLPIISLCGGAMDALITSEACILPHTNLTLLPLRSTVFTSALEGAWTGVGHREMVWCHQVRWRVARATLEMSAVSSSHARAHVLDQWLRDGRSLPTNIPYPTSPPSDSAKGSFTLPDPSDALILSQGEQLVLKKPARRQTYLLPFPEAQHEKVGVVTKFVAYVSQGAIGGLSPQKGPFLRATISQCIANENRELKCEPLRPTTLKLIPNPASGTIFPVPKEGTDESEGVVLFEGHITISPKESRYIAVRVESTTESGWLYAGFNRVNGIISDASTAGLLFGGTATIHLPDGPVLHTTIEFPNILSHALLIYRVEPIERELSPSCPGALLSPLLEHNSSLVESHFYPLLVGKGKRILTHTHLPAPYVKRPFPLPRGVRYDIWTTASQGCGNSVEAIRVTLDWKASMGRMGSRYMTTVVTWTVGVMGIIIFEAWGGSETRKAPLTTVSESLVNYAVHTLPRLLLASVFLGLVPFPEKYYLGTLGDVHFAIIAPLLLFIASGLVCVVWWVLLGLMFPLKFFGRANREGRKEELRVRRSTLFSMAFVFILIFLFIPWQVAFLGCWLIHLNTCASALRDASALEKKSQTPSTNTSDSSNIPLLARNSNAGADGHERGDGVDESSTRVQVPNEQEHRRLRMNDANHNAHVLLLMTLLLPLAAPVLAVWVRTLATAGLTTPFDGDHFFLNVAPFLVYVDYASWAPGPVFERQSFEHRLSLRWAFLALAATGFFLGPRQAYSVFEAARVIIGLIILVRIGRRYWGGLSWSPVADKRVW